MNAADLRGVRLVAHRELTTKVATPAFAGGTVMMAALAAAGAALTPEFAGSGFPIGDVMTALGLAGIGIVLLLLWGLPMATDVVSEKASRVVELLLATLRPWQLLLGKVLATTVIALTQLVAMGVGTGIGLGIAGRRVAVEPDAAIVAVGACTMLLALISGFALIAGLAARVERQEELAGVVQPALGLLLVPFAVTTWLVFYDTHSGWLDVASLAPVTNLFALPARMAVEAVPTWQIALSLLVAGATVVALVAAAGRIYAGSVLRNGRRVRLAEALRAR